MKALLLSTYDLGHQSFGLASPAAWLKEAGHDVTCIDLAVRPLVEKKVIDADLIALYLPMHTATRLTAELLPRLRKLNKIAHICCYGLYAPLNQKYLRSLGADSFLGGEFEEAIAALPHFNSGISLSKLTFKVPDRSGLPPLADYAYLDTGGGGQRIAGYTEATRGCKHLCRHCPIVPIYGGQFRIVQKDIVLADIRQQVDAGAEHISFGDPDFFNAPGHSLPIIEQLHRDHPGLTYDVTIKVEHLIKHAGKLSYLAKTGCQFVTTAVESVEDKILVYLDKGHTRQDFIKAVEIAEEAGINLSPTFVPFSPWTTIDGYRDLLSIIAELDLIENVAPVQLAIRLLIPEGSRLLELAETHACIDGFDQAGLSYRWTNPDKRVDELYETVRTIVEVGEDRLASFEKLWQAAHGVSFKHKENLLHYIPRMSEPWYCCAEPNHDQLNKI